MTPEDQAIYDELAELIRAADGGQRPNKTRWIEYACHLIRTYRGIVSRGYAYAAPTRDIAVPKVHPDAVLIPGEELQAP